LIRDALTIVLPETRGGLINGLLRLTEYETVRHLRAPRIDGYAMLVYNPLRGPIPMGCLHSCPCSFWIYQRGLPYRLSSVLWTCQGGVPTPTALPCSIQRGCPCMSSAGSTELYCSMSDASSYGRYVYTYSALSCLFGLDLVSLALDALMKWLLA
jgi:hypothetical protein